MKNIQSFELFELNSIKLSESEESVSKGEYSTEEMDKFIRELVSTMDWSAEMELEPWKRKKQISIPLDRNASTPAKGPEDVIKAWDAIVDKYGSDQNIRWYVWTADVGGSLNKPKKFDTQRFDIDSILSIAKKYPDAIRSLSLGFGSDEQNQFANYMRKEWYGTGKYTDD